jgi:hypothetical protein
MAEIPTAALQVPAKLRELFTDRLPECESNNTAEQREANFQSRALAAYAIYKLSGCSLEEAAGSVVDGGGDGGIDAFFYSHVSQTLWVVQSKYIASGRGEPDLKEVNTFMQGLNFLLEGKFQAFSQNKAKAWQQIAPQLESIFKRLTQVRPVLVYSGLNIVSEDRRFLFEDLKDKFNSDEEDYVDFQLCNLTTIHDWLVGVGDGIGVPQVELTVQNPSWTRSPYETVLGLIPLRDLAALYDEHGRSLVAANIRYYKGKTAVNDGILQTMREEPEHFFYLNNGLTAYCDRLTIHNLDRTKADSKRITAKGFSIVNGAQTLGSIAEFLKEASADELAGSVFIKVISLERCEEDRKFAERITRSTNFQNQIGSRDFVALDEQQERIANELMLSDITYHYKDDAEMPDLDECNFDLKEATVASACLAISPDCDDFCARLLADRASLWSMGDDYPAEERLRSRYARVFRDDRSARTLWRAVQAQRLLVSVIRELASTEIDPVRKAFLKASRFLLLNVLFIKVKPQQGNEMMLSSGEVVAVIESTAVLAEALWELCEQLDYVTKQQLSNGETRFELSRPFVDVFGSAADCQRLRGALLAKLAINKLSLK